MHADTPTRLRCRSAFGCLRVGFGCGWFFAAPHTASPYLHSIRRFIPTVIRYGDTLFVVVGAYVAVTIPPHSPFCWFYVCSRSPFTLPYYVTFPTVVVPRCCCPIVDAVLRLPY